MPETTPSTSELNTLERPLIQRSMHVSDWGVKTSRGHVRKANEDAWAESRRRWFMVADGMGGEEGGRMASTSAVVSFMRHSGPELTDWVSMLALLNEDVHRALVSSGTPNGGTTVVALGLMGGQVSVAHIGDSRAYRFCPADQTIQLLTVDHSVEEELRAAGESVEHYRHNVGRTDALTRYVGGGSPHSPTVGLPVTQAGDRILLCSDGVHGQLDAAQLVADLRQPSCALAAEALVRRADDAGGRDNATAIVVELSWGAA